MNGYAWWKFWKIAKLYFEIWLWFFLGSDSDLSPKYQETRNHETAAEILAQKIQQIQEQQANIEWEKQKILDKKERKKNPGVMDSMIQSATKSIGMQLGRSLGKKIGWTAGGDIGADIVRGILGSIFK